MNTPPSTHPLTLLPYHAPGLFQALTTYIWLVLSAEPSGFLWKGQRGQISPFPGGHQLEQGTNRKLPITFSLDPGSGPYKSHTSLLNEIQIVTGFRTFCLSYRLAPKWGPWVRDLKDAPNVCPGLQLSHVHLSKKKGTFGGATVSSFLSFFLHSYLAWLILDPSGFKSMTC